MTSTPSPNSRRNQPPLLLAGAGAMAIEYAKVLKNLRRPFIAVGRSPATAHQFQSATGVTALTGGIDAWIKKTPVLPPDAIVAVSEDQLGQVTLKLLSRGVHSILVEKPGGFSTAEIQQVAREASRRKARVFVAYNRRFYASVLKAEDIIREDGGVTSFSFEFTEWSHIISTLNKAPGVKEAWFLHNSTHVIDLAFFLGGWPKTMRSYIRGSLPWHSRASIFAGAGVSEDKALFSYQANWSSPGRWGVEFLTKKHRLILRPMEMLQIQKTGSVRIEEVSIDNRYDLLYKPGLYRQILSFLGKKTGLATIAKQADHIPTFEKILHGS